MGKNNSVWVRYFRDKRRFADLFNGVCFQGKPILNAGNLTEGSEVYEGLGKMDADASKIGNVHGGIRDIKMRYKDKEIFRILAVEDQATVDYSMPFRCMQYDTMEYGRQLEEIHKRNEEEGNYANWAERICRFKKTDRLIPVYTLCFYHGEEKWDGPRTLKDMMYFGDEQDGMSNLFVDYAFLLFCLNEETDLSVFHTEIRDLFEILRYRRNKTALRRLLEEKPEYLHVDADTMEVAAMALNAPYIWKQREQYLINSESEEYNMCQALREWAEEERVLGEQKKLMEQVCKKLNKGKSVELIAEELDEELCVIQEIWNFAKAYAPDYDSNKVFSEWISTQNL